MHAVLAWLAAGSPPHYAFAVLALVLLWECWLGKTKAIAANSSLELLGSMIVGLARRLLPWVAVEADVLEDKPPKRADGGYISTNLLLLVAGLVYGSMICAVLVVGGGCGPIVKHVATDIGACALDQLPGAVLEVVPDVAAALQGSEADWQAEIRKLESRGLSFAICSVKAALADFKSGHRRSARASVPPSVAISRGESYLRAHGIQ